MPFQAAVRCYLLAAVQEAVKSWTESGVKSPLMACLALRQRRFVKFLGMLFWRLDQKRGREGRP